MVHLELKELHLFSSLVDINDALFLVSDFLCLNSSLKFNDLVLVSQFFVLQVEDLLFKVVLAMLRQQLLPHGEGDSALVQSLICSVSQLDIISDSQEEQAPLRLIKRHLSDNLIEALLEQFLTDGAEPGLTRLPLEQLLVEHLTEPGHIDTTGWLVAHLLHEVLTLLDPLSRRQNLVEDVLSPQRSFFHRWQSSTLFDACYKFEKRGVTVV